MKKLQVIARGLLVARNKSSFEKDGKTTLTERLTFSTDADAAGNNVALDLKKGPEDKTDYVLFQRYEVTLTVGTYKDALYASTVSAITLKDK